MFGIGPSSQLGWNRRKENSRKENSRKDMINQEDRLSALFSTYRAACPEVEPGKDFTPGLWRKIDARRGITFKLRRYTQGLVTVAATLCFAMGFFELSPLFKTSVLYTSTYVEALDADHGPEQLAFADVVNQDDPSENEIQ